MKNIFTSMIMAAIVLGIFMPFEAKAAVTLKIPSLFAEKKEDGVTFCKLTGSAYEVTKTVKMMITAYSSTPDQTDETPFITASGKYVQDGIVANNMLPFGTKVKIPELYGDKIFTVQDRMHSRKGDYHLDIWFPEYQQAKDFGAKVAYIEVLQK